MALPDAPPLTTIVTPKGVKFTVATQYAPQFTGLVTDLENAGYPINSQTSGGYNRRVIAGTTTPSEHAFGRAIDVNWDQNPHGSPKFSIPPALAHQLAGKYNMTWGGDWSGPTQDAMHFQVANSGGNPGSAMPAAMIPASTVAPGTQDRTVAPVDTGPSAASGVDLATTFSDRLQQLQAQQAALAQQGQGVAPKPLGFGLPNPVASSLQQVAQNFQTPVSVNAPAVTKTPTFFS